MPKKVICPKCGYGKKKGEWNRRSRLSIARCPNCGSYQRTKKFPDRRYKRNRNKGAPDKPDTPNSPAETQTPT